MSPWHILPFLLTRAINRPELDAKTRQKLGKLARKTKNEISSVIYVVDVVE